MSEFAGVVDLLLTGGPYVLLLFFLYLFYTGKVVSSNVVEKIVKVAVAEVVEQMRQSVADGVRDAFDMPDVKKER